MEAYHLRTDLWAEFMETEDGRTWMFPILTHLIDEYGNPLVGANQNDLDALLDMSSNMTPDMVPNIFSYWQTNRSR